MNATPNRLRHLVLGCCALVCANVATAQDSERCKAPQGAAEEQACSHARKSPEALRNFVQRTRLIYGLYYWDFAPGPEQQAARAATTTASEKPDPSTNQRALAKK